MPTRATFSFDPVSWGAVMGGVFVALVVHILLNMLGAGLGAASLHVGARSPDAVQSVSWGAFAWWSVSGIIAAFAGGYAAGSYASSGGAAEGSAHGFLSWAVTTVLIVTFAAIVAGGTAATAGALLSPLSTATAQLQGGSEDVQRAFATFTLASVAALLIGAAVAAWGGRLAASHYPPASRRAHGKSLASDPI